MGWEPLVDALHQALKALKVASARLLVAVSGGADSVALLRGLHELARPFDLQLMIAHYQHGLRATAEADAVFVQSLGEVLHIPVILGRADAADVPLTGIEAWARNVRYQFLQTTAEQHACPIVMTAHTVDDQVETVLHHLFRGTGLSGLAGIPRERALSERCRLIRPLTSVWRAEIEAYLASVGQQFCLDETNADLQFRRNWLRHQLLPLIRTAYPEASAAIWRLSQHAAEATETLDSLADSWLNQAIMEAVDELVILDAQVLQDCPDFLLRTVLVRLWTRQNWPRQGMTAESWEQAAHVVRGTVRATHCPGGGEVRRDRDRVAMRGGGILADSAGPAD